MSHSSASAAPTECGDEVAGWFWARINNESGIVLALLASQPMGACFQLAVIGDFPRIKPGRGGQEGGILSVEASPSPAT